jgi:CheY-like chemotaxis protein
MLQKLGEHIANCLMRAEAAERRASDAPDTAFRTDYEEVAKGWRQLARSYEFAESLKRFLLVAKKTDKVIAQPDGQPPPEVIGKRIIAVSLDGEHDLQPRASILDGLRVLVVEDSWQVSAAMKRLLEACGANVAGPAATTADAARLVSERRIDVALVDIHLRGGELAYDLIDQLHAQGIRIVVVTGYADVLIDERKVAAVLQKPVSGPRLLQSLRAAALG